MRQLPKSEAGMRRISAVGTAQAAPPPPHTIEDNNICRGSLAITVLHRPLNSDWSNREGADVNKYRTLVIHDREEFMANSRRENIRIVEPDRGQLTQRRQCLTCKNKGCVGRCRFAKPITDPTPIRESAA